MSYKLKKSKEMIALGIKETQSFKLLKLDQLVYQIIEWFGS
jgi:hypothetical protein